METNIDVNFLRKFNIQLNKITEDLFNPAFYREIIKTKLKFESVNREEFTNKKTNYRTVKISNKEVREE